MLVDKFWSDMCKKEASTLFLIYTLLYTLAINDVLKHMTPEPEDEYASSPDTPAPTPVDGRYYTLNSPGMAVLLVIYTLVPLYFIYQLSWRAHTTDEDTRDEERKALMERCVRTIYCRESVSPRGYLSLIHTKRELSPATLLGFAKVTVSRALCTFSAPSSAGHAALAHRRSSTSSKRDSR